MAYECERRPRRMLPVAPGGVNTADREENAQLEVKSAMHYYSTSGAPVPNQSHHYSTSGAPLLNRSHHYSTTGSPLLNRSHYNSTTGPPLLNRSRKKSIAESSPLTPNTKCVEDDVFVPHLTDSDVTLCTVHCTNKSVAERGICRDRTAFGSTAENAPKPVRARSYSHRTESPYRFLSESTSGISPVRSFIPAVESDHSAGSKSLSSAKIHSHLPVMNVNNNYYSMESNRILHDNSCSLYSLDELDAMRGRAPAQVTLTLNPLPVINIQPARYSDKSSRNNNDYVDFPEYSLTDDSRLSDTVISVSNIASSATTTVLRQEHERLPRTSCERLLICQKCRRCRGLCCSRKMTRRPRTYIGRQEISAKCAIDWCTCMLCAAAVLRCIPRPDDELRDEEEDDNEVAKRLQSLPCSSCCDSSSDYHQWCCCLRGTAVALMCLPCLPCLTAYWPLRCLERTCARCCRPDRAKGCRCDDARIEGGGSVGDASNILHNSHNTNAGNSSFRT